MKRKRQGLTQWLKSKKNWNLHPRSIVIGMILGVFLFILGQKGVSWVWVKNQLSDPKRLAFYVLGQQQARQVDAISMSASEAKVFALGFYDWAGLGKSQVNYEEFKPKLRGLLDDRKVKQLEQEKKRGQEYLNEFVRRQGGTRSLSGMAYQIKNPGSEKKPTFKDWVEVKYQAKLLNGTVIDGTPATGETAKFPLNGVIPGWSEGIQWIGEGGTIELVVPSHLAYGDHGTQAGVPPGATLIFRIHLVKVIEGGLKR